MAPRLPIILKETDRYSISKYAYSLFLFILNYITLLVKYVDNFSGGVVVLWKINKKEIYSTL